MDDNLFPPAIEPQKQRRGFALLSASRLREISSKGARAAHAKGTAHKWNSEEAKEAAAKSHMPEAKKKRYFYD